MMCYYLNVHFQGQRVNCAPHNYEGALKFVPLWRGGRRFIFLKWLSSSRTIITYSVLRQVHIIFQSEFSPDSAIQCILLQIYSILSIPQSHPAAAYVFFLVPSILPSILSSVTWFKMHFLRKMWPIQLAFLPFIVCVVDSSPPWFFVTLLHSSHNRSNWSSPSFSSNSLPKLSRDSWYTSRNVQVFLPHRVMLQT